MYKYKLVLAYDGSQYAGWQVQPSEVSIQSVLQERLALILQAEVSVVGAGRTDAGVHARGQVAHFESERDLDLYRFSHSINAVLPIDIRVTHVELVPQAFHARYGASSKQYTYHICRSKVHSPFRRLYQWHYPHTLDLAAMRAGATQLLGTHDFTSFANSATEGSAARNPVRCLTRLELIENEGELRFVLQGESFLYKMVRNIVGTLVELGRGKPHDMLAILTARDRRCAGSAAPAHGLFLDWISYKTASSDVS